MADDLSVEVVLATPERQVLLTVNVEAGVVADLAVGIWGKPVSRDSTVNAGDRIELYRPLDIDPREARRQRARAEAG